MKRNQNIVDVVGLVAIILALVALHSSGAWTGFAHGADSNSRGRSCSHRHQSNDRWNSDNRRDSSERRQRDPQSPNAAPQDATLVLVAMQSSLKQFTDMEVAGGTAYLGVNARLGNRSDENQGLTILNVADPANPIISETYLPPWFGPGTETSFWGAPIALSEGLLVLNAYYQYSSLFEQIQLLDISSPLTPIQMSTFPIAQNFSEPPYDRALFSPSGDALLVETRYGGISLQNISNPANPQWVSSNFPYRAYGVWQDDMLLARSRENEEELIALNMMNPLEPSIIFRDSSSHHVKHSMHASNGFFYVVDGLTGVFTVSAWNLGGGEFDHPVGRYHGFRRGHEWNEAKMVGVGSLIVLCYGGGVDLISFADPSAPRLLERQFLDFSVIDIEVSDGYVYMLSFWDGLFIFRIDSQP